MRYLSLLLLLSACSFATPIKTADGTTQYFIECTDMATYCIEKANETCPEGYDIVDRNNSISGAFFEGSGGISSDTNMIIKCAAPKVE